MKPVECSTCRRTLANPREASVCRRCEPHSKGWLLCDLPAEVLTAMIGIAAERDRLRAGLEMIAQVRHVSGSAQGAFRGNLAIADAVLAGADVASLATVEAISRGEWKYENKSHDADAMPF